MLYPRTSAGKNDAALLALLDAVPLGGLAAGAAGIAKTRFCVFLILAVVSFIGSVARGKE